MEEKNIKNDFDETAESDLEATKEELEEQGNAFEQEALNELNSKYLRLNADFQNYRRRVEKEKTDIYNFANEKIIGDILPVLDNLERALNSAKDEKKQDESVTKGVELVLQQLKDVLKNHGVEEIEAVGKEFDPNLHHAVMQEEHQEYESNKVIEVYQKGYILNSKVIRPSMVKVAI